jgi:hypothetical protein
MMIMHYGETSVNQESNTKFTWFTYLQEMKFATANTNSSDSTTSNTKVVTTCMYL